MYCGLSLPKYFLWARRSCILHNITIRQYHKLAIFGLPGISRYIFICPPESGSRRHF